MVSNKKAIPSITISELTDLFMIFSFNNTRKDYINYLALAKWTWKELLKGTIWAIQSKYLPVDKSTMPYTITVPNNMRRFLNVSETDDCGRLQDYDIDRTMNVLKKPATIAKCKCHGDAGCDDGLCDAIDSIVVVTKDVVIDTVHYTEKTWTIRQNNGDLVQIREVPVKNFSAPDTYTITYDKQETLLCTLEVNEVGCIKPTEENKKHIARCCGHFLLLDLCCEPHESWHNRHHEKLGSVKPVAGDKMPIRTKADWVIFSYEIDEENPDEETLIPEIAVETAMFGMDYRAKAFRPNATRYEKQESKRAWNSAHDDLLSYLDPIRVDEFIETGRKIYKW